MQRLVILLAALALGARLTCVCHGEPTRFRIATFNIEDFPKDDRQIRGAFEEIEKLDVPIVAVEEIMNPKLFAKEASRRLGKNWHVVFEPFVEIGYRHTGVLFDRDAYKLLSTSTYDDTRLGGDHKAVLEVRLKGDAGTIRVLVVHLKCCAEGREIRARQYAALANIVRGAVASGEHVVVLGDFNATDDDGDRADLAKLATAGDLYWSTESLACSAFWDREDDCPRSRLDHIITWRRGTPTAYGACATHGCKREDSCPIYADQISDHCPVVVELD